MSPKASTISNMRRSGGGIFVFLSAAFVVFGFASAVMAIDPTPTATEPVPTETPVPGPDLVVRIPLVNVSVGNTGVTLDMSAIIENTGDVASSSFRVGFSVEGQEVEVNHGGVAPGEVVAVAKTTRFDLGAGPHVLAITADSADAVAESDESNNTGTVGFNVNAADLVVDGLVVTATPKGGGFSLSLEATVRNVGAAAAGRFSIDFVPNGAGFHGGGKAAISGLAAGAMATATGKLSAPAGFYNIAVVLDPSDRVLETNEVNNVAKFDITVP